MQIETNLKCKKCGAHAPIVYGELQLKCMTCEYIGYPLADFAAIPDRSSQAKPTARNRMTQQEFESFVAARWNQHCSDTDQDFLPFSVLTQPEVEALMGFALALINDAPN